MIRRRLALLVATVGPFAVASGQDGIRFTAGYVLAGRPDQSSWRLAFQRNLAGPIGLDIGAQVLPGARPTNGDLYGFEVDFTFFEGAARLPAVFFGAAAGIGVQQQDRVFYGASAGLRLPIVTLGPVRLPRAGWGRPRAIGGRDALEVGAPLGGRKARVSATSRPDATGLYVPRGTSERLRAAGIPEEKARLIGSVVSTAIEEMGQPYVWGGTGDGSGGFDCSGLIYYAYGRYNIRIPRTSAGQANAGIAIRRESDALLPGDILTFAESGSTVTHVGLYVGEDRFIHSASGGVRLSRLAEDDPYGRYWLRRWVGVRRVVE